jgi:hypothetical protein
MWIIHQNDGKSNSECEVPYIQSITKQEEDKME